MSFVVCKASKSDYKWAAERSFAKMYHAEEYVDAQDKKDVEYCILTKEAATSMGMIVPPVREHLSDAYWAIVNSSASASEKLRLVSSLRHFANDDECDCSEDGECHYCITLAKCYDAYDKAK
jgi:hypothetical protein